MCYVLNTAPSAIYTQDAENQLNQYVATAISYGVCINLTRYAIATQTPNEQKATNKL